DLGFGELLGAQQRRNALEICGAAVLQHDESTGLEGAELGSHSRAVLEPRYEALTDRAQRRIADALTSMSSRVVAMSLTERRMARGPCQVVPPAQHVPSAWTAAITASVTASLPNATRSWLITTGARTSAPPAESSAANRAACAEVCSIRLASPSRPCEASIAQTSTARAR